MKQMQVTYLPRVWRLEKQGFADVEPVGVLSGNSYMLHRHPDALHRPSLQGGGWK